MKAATFPASCLLSLLAILPAFSQSPSPADSTPAGTTNGASTSQPATDTLTQLNDALGFSLFADDHFWDNALEDVAKRLKWPQESETATEASYRRYSLNGVPVLDAGAYSLALYGRNGKPTYISLVFSNAGDFPEAADYHGTNAPAILDKLQKDLAVAVTKDVDAITARLTALLGQPETTLFGNSSSNREEVHRWDWKDVSFLLSSHNGAYATLKIIPTKAADRFGTVEVTDRDQLKDLLAKRVDKKENGDVVITQIPMVDQGPKGYCAPATWERYLRYVDVPADLYVLAMLANSNFGGGTSTDAMRAGVNDYVSAYHRRIEVVQDPLDLVHVARYIDKGLPLMWSCHVTGRNENEIDYHTYVRRGVTDWTSYQKLIEADDKLREDREPNPRTNDNLHMRMIIGYNATTNELAISDSWGPKAAERWITLKAANDISDGDLEYIQW